jgi:hypothetical protein
VRYSDRMASVDQLPELIEKLSLHTPNGVDDSDEIDSLLKTIANLFSSIYGELLNVNLAVTPANR